MTQDTPFGFLADGPEGKLRPEETEREVLYGVLALLEGRGNRCIAEIMNQSGVMHRGEPWTATHIKTIRKWAKRNFVVYVPGQGKTISRFQSMKEAKEKKEKREQKRGMRD
jgi:hypothetical protein